MARKYAAFNVPIWQDNDWRALPREAQHLYMVLWTHPLLNYAGVLDWRPGRLAALTHGWTVDQVQEAGDCLEARLFIVTDPDTEETLIRSWFRFDGLMAHNKMCVSFANAFAAVASNDIRGVLVHEARKLRKMQPDLVAWTKPQVLSILDLEALDPRDRDRPSDPLAPGLAPGLAPAVAPGFAETSPSASPKDSPRTSPRATPAPTPTPSLHAEKLGHETSENTHKRSPAEPEGFEDFWKTYPRRDDKGHARTAWVRATKKATPAQITAGASRYARATADTDRKFIALAATWLNGERWTDEHPPAGATPGQPRTAWDRVPTVEQLRAQDDADLARDQAGQERP